MSYQYTNNASSTLASGITSGSPTITLSTGTGALFPVLAGGNIFRGTLVDAATQTLREIVQVTATAGDTFTITRAQEGTIARAYNSGDIFYLDVTAAQYADFFSKTYDSYPNQTGRLINVQVITSTGTYTPTSGTNSIVFWLVGGGGGGGGCPACAINNGASSSGGAGGAVSVHRATAGFSGQTVTIGTGGAGGTGAAVGTSGGNSTFLGVTASGGTGGNAGTQTSSPFVTVGSGTSSSTGANIANIRGESGQTGVVGSSSSGVGGAGGGNWITAFTTPCAFNNTVSDGFSGIFPGGGGSGAVNALGGVGSASARTGGAGANGVCIIYEYA